MFEVSLSYLVNLGPALAADDPGFNKTNKVSEMGQQVKVLAAMMQA